MAMLMPTLKYMLGLFDDWIADSISRVSKFYILYPIGSLGS